MGEQWHSDHLPCILPCALTSQTSTLEARFVCCLLTDQLLGLYFQQLWRSLFLLLLFPLENDGEGSPVWSEVALKYSLECELTCGAYALN